MYAVIDIEGNGAGFRQEKIIEIAIYRFDGHRITDQFISLVNPKSEITPFVQRLTKISPKMVQTAPAFHELAKRIVEITEDATLVGHNIDFDYRMLRQEFKTLGYDFKINTIDTIPLAQKLIPDAETYSLGKLAKSLGIPLTDHHRAAGDAKATLELFKLLLFKDRNSEIIQQHHEEVNAKSYLNRVKALTQDLPFGRGIIYFQDATGKILFYDYARDMRKFAKAAFNSKSKKWEQVQAETEQIAFDLTGSDVLAKLILQSKGLKLEEALPYGLYYRADQYRVEKTSLTFEEPLVKFKSFTQGLKAVRFINTREQFRDPETLRRTIDTANRSEIWSGPGRTLGDKAFVIWESGQITGFGFYDLHTQISSRAKIDKLKMPVTDFPEALQNDVKLALLREDFEILPLPQK